MAARMDVVKKRRAFLLFSWCFALDLDATGVHDNTSSRLIFMFVFGELIAIRLQSSSLKGLWPLPQITA
jgi:hypothetical protein